ncbi:MAG: extracellular solute-binding protein [Longimicrobiales bacterium]|nr:extracellular solute-binding protein [Longimicrobiales bacterium]
MRAVVGLLAVAWLGAGCSDPGATAVVYTSLEPELLDWAADAFTQSHPELRVRFVRLSADEALERLAAERGAPVADAWWGAPSWRLARGAEEGLLATARPTWADRVPEGLKDAQGRWFGTLGDPLVLAFNTDSVARSVAPRDWLDLLHPRWSGELLLPEPGRVDAMTALLAWRVWAARAQRGDDFEWMDWFARLDASRAAYLSDAGDAARRLHGAEALLAILPLSAAERARAAGWAVDYRVPESGTPVLIQGVAVVAGAPHAGPAEAFLEWVGSPEAVAGLGARIARVPVPGFPAFAPGAAPEWAGRVVPALLPQLVPTDSVATLVDGWVGRWRDDVRGKVATLF